VLDYDAALDIARRHLAAQPDTAMHDLVIAEPHACEHPLVWALAYNSRAYVERGDERALLVGPGYFLIDRETGAVIETASTYDAEGWVERYARRRTGHTLKLTDLLD